MDEVARHPDEPAVALDVGAYCRAVEDHLTRVNGGHLVRVVGPGFVLVRAWADAGVPLSVVCHGITTKAERHRAGASRRPLRLEFCEDDVRETYEHWRRAIGVAPAADLAETAVARDSAPANPRRPAIGAHLERAIDRLTRAAGRLELPASLRDLLAERVGELAELRETAKGARGAAREALIARLAELDGSFGVALQQAAPASVVDEVRAAAERDLGAYRQRMSAAAWDGAIAVTVDRLLRDRFGLPTLSV